MAEGIQLAAQVAWTMLSLPLTTVALTVSHLSRLQPQVPTKEPEEDINVNAEAVFPAAARPVPQVTPSSVEAPSRIPDDLRRTLTADDFETDFGVREVAPASPVRIRPQIVWLAVILLVLIVVFGLILLIWLGHR
jgi:hypothetical protein